MLHFLTSMTQIPDPDPSLAFSRSAESEAALFYCPQCAREVHDPLTCGDCSAVICRQCGSPLESSDDLGIG